MMPEGPPSSATGPEKSTPRADAGKVLKSRPPAATLGPMKILLRAVVFLAMLFVVLYIGMNNTHLIDFSFPLLLKEKIRATAAVVYFAVFAVGVVAGLALGSGSGKSRGSSEGRRKN